MDNKQQRKASALETPRAAPPPGNDLDGSDLKVDARKYKAHQKAITRGLRTFFDSVAAEPVPDEFMDLLRKMDENGPDR
jgi:hypothetical protein